MSAAPAITSQTPATAGSQAATTNSATRFSQDMDSFLKIFITQLNHQDPLEPMDSSDFVNQMANMSGVEQAINTNKKLDTLIGQNGTRDSSALLSFIGKDVEVESQSITLEDGKPTGISYTLDPADMPKDVFVTVRDPSGKTVFNGHGSQNQGRNNVSWDGVTNDGNKAKPGIYEVFVTVQKGDNSVTTIPTMVRGRVVGANLDGDKPSLIVNGAEIPFDEVKFISEPGVLS